MSQKPKTKFPSDAHDVVMIIRTSIEMVVFFAFVVFSEKIAWLQNFENINGLKIGVTAALNFIIILLIKVIKNRFTL